MATKNVIAEAIRQLEKTNNTLYGRLDVATTAKEGREIMNEIQKNQSMILDYNFRLTYDE